MYHRIGETEADPWKLAVPPELFDEQLQMLKRARTVLSLSEFARLYRESHLPANATAITFDDGYACNALVATPLLEKHKLPATVFIATGLILSGEEFWWDALERIVFTADTQTLVLATLNTTEVVELGNKGELDGWSNWDATHGPASARQAAYLDLWRRLRAAQLDERKEAIASLRAQAGILGPARESHRGLSASEISLMLDTGLIEIGAHTVSHPVLSQLTLAEQRAEIAQSRDDCLALVGYKPKAFAYPYGEYNGDTISIVADAGFEIACTTQTCGVDGRFRNLELPRLQVRAWDAAGLLAAIRNLGTTDAHI
jgi:peptidoglycan/xylan/chitin deacetylase (PgdA/CDA1 family)